MVDEAVRDLEVAVDGDDLVLSWSAADGVAYSVLASADLSGSAWAPDPGMPVSVEDGIASARDLGAAVSGGRRFYRVGAAFD